MKTSLAILSLLMVLSQGCDRSKGKGSDTEWQQRQEMQRMDREHQEQREEQMEIDEVELKDQEDREVNLTPGNT